MKMINPEKVKLFPGQSFHGLYAPGPNAQGQVGFFVRSVAEFPRSNGNLGIQQRAGAIKFNDVLLVLTMIRVYSDEVEEIFDIWWNFYSEEEDEEFRRISQQDTLTVHFYDEAGKEFSIATSNSFQKFFKYLEPMIKKTTPWTDIEFDRAVRGFCAQSYPRENLWDLIEFRPDGGQGSGKHKTVEDYPGYIPEELRPFYSYDANQGHSIRIIPSMLEQDALLGNPEDFVHPAPVKSVVRCGIRWIKGFPVAAIPFIPGHGLAVPPDDSEF
jgi:hypothetical protein